MCQIPRPRDINNLLSRGNNEQYPYRSVKGIALRVFQAFLWIAYPLSRIKRLSALVSLISVGWLPHFNVFDSDFRIGHMSACLTSLVSLRRSSTRGSRVFRCYAWIRAARRRLGGDVLSRYTSFPINKNGWGWQAQDTLRPSQPKTTPTWIVLWLLLRWRCSPSCCALRTRSFSS